jgi:hypothetical protein
MGTDDDQGIVGALLCEFVPHPAVEGGLLTEEDDIGTEITTAPGRGTAFRGITGVTDPGPVATAHAAEVDNRAVEVEYLVLGEPGPFEEVVDILGHDEGVVVT